jgi:hypothetical protein
LIYINEEQVKVSWDEATQCIMSEWYGMVPTAKLRGTLEKILELCQQKATKRYLADISQLTVVTKDDEAWLGENWFPRAMAAGVKSFAFVIPKSALTRLSANEVIRKVPNTDKEMTQFSSLEEAKKWLRSR